MKLLTKEIEKKLIQNHEAQVTKEGHYREKGLKDFEPVVKFFGGAACTWLITEYNPRENMFFGLCDLGVGFPELGYVSREELESIKFPPFGLPVERDRHWEAKKTLSQYAKEAQANQRIMA